MFTTTIGAKQDSELRWSPVRVDRPTVSTHTISGHAEQLGIVSRHHFVHRVAGCVQFFLVNCHRFHAMEACQPRTWSNWSDSWRFRGRCRATLSEDFIPCEENRGKSNTSWIASTDTIECQAIILRCDLCGFFESFILPALSTVVGLISTTLKFRVPYLSQSAKFERSDFLLYGQ